MKRWAAIFLVMVLILVPLSTAAPEEGYIGWLWNEVLEAWDYWFSGEVIATSIAEPPTVESMGKAWNLRKATGPESNFTLKTTNVKDKKTDICFVLKPGTTADTSDRSLYDESGVILDDKAKAIVLKYETAKCDGQDGYHISLTNTQAVNIDDYIRLGEASIEAVYEDLNQINYNLGFADMNISLVDTTLPSHISNISITPNADGYKFAGVENAMGEGDLHYFNYQVSSTDPIYLKGWTAYLKNPKKITSDLGVHEVQEQIKFHDVCMRNFEPYEVEEDVFGETYTITYYNKSADCEFEQWEVNIGNETDPIYNYYLNVSFLSDKYIDPTITNITADAVFEDVICESDKFCHLNVSDANLVLYMPFDVKNQSASIYDWTDNDNDGSGANQAVWVSGGKYGGAYEFDGTGDQIDIPVSGTSLDITTDNLTVAGWIKRDAAGDKWTLFGSSASYTGGYWCGGQTAHTYFYLDGINNEVFAGYDIGEGSWEHVACVWNGTDQIFYHDGAEAGKSSGLSPGAITNNGALGAVGGITIDTYDTDGLIDEVMVFNRALSPTEINQIYEQSFERFAQTGNHTIKPINISSGNNMINVSLNISANQFYDDVTNISTRVGTINESFAGMNDSLVLYMPFEWGEAWDISGTGNDGTIVADSFWTSTGGRNNTGGFYFDGTGDYINVGEPDNLKFGNFTDFTISYWINGNSTAQADVPIGYNKQAGYGELQFGYIYAGKIRFWIVDSASTNVNGYMGNVSLDDTWHHVLVSADRDGNAVIYFDGLPDTVIDISTVGNITAMPGQFWSVGAYSGLLPFKGHLDEAMIWSRSLSDAEVLALFQNQSRKYTDLTYTEPQNMTNGVNTTFTVSPTAGFVSFDQLFQSNASQFWSPILYPPINYDTFTSGGEPADDPPVSILSFPADNANFTQSTIVTHECNATDDVNLANVTLYVWNEDTSLNHTNFTAWTGVANSTRFEFNYTGNQLYEWNCLVYDNATQSDWDVNRTLNITAAVTPDVTPPNVTINTPLNQTYNTTTIDFNVTALDVTGVADCEYSLDDGVTNISMANAGDEWFDQNTTMTQGSQLANFYCNDTLNNINDSESVAFFIDSILPTLTIGYPTNITYTSARTEFNITIFDANLQACWQSNNSGATNTTFTCGTNVTGMNSSEGSNTWIVYANDTAGNTNQTEVTFTVDSIPIGLTITFPTNISYATNVSDLNYTWTNGGSPIESCLYSRDEGVTNSSHVAGGTNFTDVTSIEGSNTWTLYCNDTLNQWNSTDVTFFKDTIFPTLNITFPLNTTYTTSPTDFNYTYIETNPNNCWWSNNSGATNNSVACGTNVTGMNSTEGDNVWTVYMNDTANNENQSIVYFFQDTEPPYFTSLVNQTIAEDQSLSYTPTAADTISTFNWSINGSLLQINSATGEITNVSALTEGYFSFNITITDALNNANSSTWDLNVTGVDSTPPTWDEEPANQVVVYNTSFSYDLNATDETAFDSFGVNDTRFTIGRTTGILINNSLLAVAEYNINLTINDTSGNENQTTILVNVTKATATTDLTFDKATPQTYGITINASCIEAYGEGGNISLYRDGIDRTNENNQDITLGAGSYFYECNISSTANFTAGTNSSTFVIDQNTSQVFTYLNHSRSNITIFNNTAIWLNGTLDTGDTGTLIELFNDDVRINHGATPLANLTAFNATGIFNITTIYPATQNYTLSTETWFVNVTSVDTTNPTINYTDPTKSDWANVTVNWTFVNVTIAEINHDENSFTLYNQSLNTTNLVGYWNFDRDLNKAYDISGNGNYADVLSGVFWNSTGKLNGAFEFNGTTDFLQRDVDPVGGYPFTIAAWVKPEDNGGDSQVVLDLVDASATSTHYGVFENDNAFWVLARNASDTSIWTASEAITFGNWYHVVGVFANETDRRIYVNGSLENSSTAHVPYEVIGVDRFSIGRAGDMTPESYMNGTIDEVMMWDRAITAEEIAGLYARTVVNYSVFSTETEEINWTNLEYGLYHYYADVIDTSSNYNFTEVRNINLSEFVDTTPPNVDIISPENATTNLTITLFSVNATNGNGIGTCLYSLDGGVTNVSMTNVSTVWNNINTTMTEGSHTANFYCNDSVNNMNDTESVTFFIDSIVPVPTITYPTNISYATSPTDFNYTYSELNPSNCWWSNNSGATNNSVACGTNLTGMNSTEGSNTWTIYMNDSATNENQSSVTFFQDTIPPYFTAAANQSLYDNESLSYDINAADDGVGLGSFAINWSSVFSIVGATGVLTNSSGLTIGNHSINVSVNDTLGNLNSSILVVEVRNSTVTDSTSPTVTNPRNFTHTVNTSFSETMAATDANGISYYSLNSTLFFNISQTGVITNVTNLSRIEIHYLNYSVNDTFNNLASFIFYINITSIKEINIKGCSSLSVLYDNENIPAVRRAKCVS